MSATASHFDVAIVGGGVIGLSIAWQTALRGATVCVLDKSEPGRGASWAGAGMTPVGPSRDRFATAGVMEQLAGHSDQLHEAWHSELLEASGIDNGYRRCGAIYLAHDQQTLDDLLQQQSRWINFGIESALLDAAAIRELEPAISTESFDDVALHVPREAQIRNPRHLRALLTACRQQGVEVIGNAPVDRLEVQAGTIVAAVSPDAVITADKYCVSTGCWTGAFLEGIGASLPVRPVRGQIALLHGPPGVLRRNINVGSRYLAPRTDGRILVGSTEEEGQWTAEPTESGIKGLLAFAACWVPSLEQLPLERGWAGLRPATLDGRPYIGKLPQLENAWVATGHFRAGLQLSPATAVVVAEMLSDQPPSIDVSELSPNRVFSAANSGSPPP